MDRAAVVTTQVSGDTDSHPSAMVPLRVLQVIRETDDAVSLVLDPASGESNSIAYRPGQFLTLRIPSELTGSVSRCYSLSSAPHEEGPLKVTVKRTPDGYGSNWLCDNAVAERFWTRCRPPVSSLPRRSTTMCCCSRPAVGSPRCCRF